MPIIPIIPNAIASLSCGCENPNTTKLEHPFKADVRLPLGIEITEDNYKEYPLAARHFYFEIPDKFGGIITITRSDNKDILLSKINSNNEVEQINATTLKGDDGSRTLKFEIDPSEEYESDKEKYKAQKWIHRVDMLDIKPETRISLSHRQEMKLKYRPWNFCYFDVSDPFDKVAGKIKVDDKDVDIKLKYTKATEILEEYDQQVYSKNSQNSQPFDKIDDSKAKAAHWERDENNGHIGGWKQGTGHCDMMAVASALFEIPIGPSSPEIKEFHKIQLLLAEASHTAIPAAKIGEDADTNSNVLFKRSAIVKLPNGPISHEDEPEWKWKISIERFHNVFQRFLSKGIPLAIDLSRSEKEGTIPWNCSIFSYIYEYREEFDSKNKVFKIRVRSVIVTNYDLGSSPPTIGDNKESCWFWREDLKTINEYFVEVFNKWCCVFFLEYNLEFDSGKTLGKKLARDNVACIGSARFVKTPTSKDNIWYDDELFMTLETSSLWDYKLWSLLTQDCDKNAKYGMSSTQNAFPVKKIWKRKKNSIFYPPGEKSIPTLIGELSLGDILFFRRSRGNSYVTQENLKALNIWQPHSDIHDIINRDPYKGDRDEDLQYD